MFCPKCKVEMRISGTRYVAENDNTADVATKVYIEQDLSCRNKQCSNNGQVVETVRTELKLSTQ